MPHDHSGHGHEGHSHAQKLAPARPNVTITPTTANITLSERAAKELNAVMQAEGAKSAGLRLSVEPGGCAGFQYALSFAEHAEPDEVSTESQGVKVFVGKNDLGVLNGLTIDYVDTPMGSGFNIKNPNAKSTCGCGNTFDA